jgi:hypothetical protein
MWFQSLPLCQFAQRKILVESSRFFCELKFASFIVQEILLNHFAEILHLFMFTYGHMVERHAGFRWFSICLYR